MDIKSLSKLAKACRRLGVSSLKTDEVEITLSSDILQAPRKRAPKLAPVNDALFHEADDIAPERRLSEHDLLFWSSENSQ